MKYEEVNGLPVALEGSVVINGVLHIVSAKYVKCDSSLNRMSWNTTEEISRCPICFPELQLDLFAVNEGENKYPWE